MIIRGAVLTRLAAVTAVAGMLGCTLISGVADLTTGQGSGGSAGFGGGAGGDGAGGSGVSTCNDGDIDPGEDCDGTDLGNEDCQSQGFPGGELACDPATCLYDTSDCEECGNGLIGDGEECDGQELGGKTCQSEGFAGGVMACDNVSCQIVGCQPHYQQDFEGSMPAELSHAGDVQWLLSTEDANNGLQAVRSGAIGHSQVSEISLTLTYDDPGELSFFHRESTEFDYDLVRFFIDGNLLGSWSGENAWEKATFVIGAGAHTFTWRYEKDAATVAGDDRVWIDDILATNGYLP